MRPLVGMRIFMKRPHIAFVIRMIMLGRLGGPDFEHRGLPCRFTATVLTNIKIIALFVHPYLLSNLPLVKPTDISPRCRSISAPRPLNQHFVAHKIQRPVMSGNSINPESPCKYNYGHPRTHLPAGVFPLVKGVFFITRHIRKGIKKSVCFSQSGANDR